MFRTRDIKRTYCICIAFLPGHPHVNVRIACRSFQANDGHRVCFKYGSNISYSSPNSLTIDASGGVDTKCFQLKQRHIKPKARAYPAFIPSKPNMRSSSNTTSETKARTEANAASSSSKMAVNWGGSWHREVLAWHREARVGEIVSSNITPGTVRILALGPLLMLLPSPGAVT